MPCRARGGPRQSAHGSLRVTVRAAVQTACHRYPWRPPRVWRAVSGGASAIARPSGALWVLPGRRGRPVSGGGGHAREGTPRAESAALQAARGPVQAEAKAFGGREGLVCPEYTIAAS